MWQTAQHPINFFFRVIGRNKGTDFKQKIRASNLSLVAWSTVAVFLEVIRGHQAQKLPGLRCQIGARFTWILCTNPPPYSLDHNKEKTSTSPPHRRQEMLAWCSHTTLIILDVALAAGELLARCHHWIVITSSRNDWDKKPRASGRIPIRPLAEAMDVNHRGQHDIPARWFYKIRCRCGWFNA